MRSWKNLSALGLVASLALTLTACGSDDEPTSGGVTEVDIYYTAPLTQFAVATVAAENDLFPDNVEVTVDGGDSTVGVSLASSGRTDFYLSTAPIPEQLAHGGAPLRLAASWQDGLNALFIGRDGVTSLEDMRGRSLGIVQPGFTLSLAAETALRDAGLAADDYQAVPLGTVPAVAGAFASGTVDGVVLDRVTATRLLAEVEGATTLFDYYTEDFPWAGSSVTVNSTFMEENPEAVTSVLVGLNRALELMRTDPEQAAAAVTEVTTLAPGEGLEEAMEDFATHSTETLEPISEDQVAEAMDALAATGEDWATTEFGLSVLAEPTYLEEALSR